MTVMEAIARVLNEAGEPLHYQEIARRAIEQGYWVTEGKTPQDTVSAQLSTDIKRKGEKSLFYKASPGIYALRSLSQEARASNTADVGTAKMTSTMTFRDAAERVLKNFVQQRPMHYRKVTHIAIEKGWLSSGGKTPEATMSAQLATEIKSAQLKGVQPRFTRHGRGFYGLSEWMGEGLHYEIERHNLRVRRDLLKQVKQLPPAEFEGLIGQLLTALGFEKVEVTKESGDGGIDVRGTLVVGGVLRIRMAVQAKRWKANVQAPIVQQVRGSLGTHDQGLIITTSGFSHGAKEEARRTNAVPVGLMNGDQLVQLLVANDIGVHRTNPDIIELGHLEEEHVANNDEPV